MRTVIYVQGGIIQGIATDHNGEVLIVDYDVDSDWEEEVFTVDNEEAYIYKKNEEQSDRDDKNVISVFKQYEDQVIQHKLRDCFIKE